ncbi:hypothetical protein [Paraburkholderia sp. ZP32-5]|uniref:hypothetical protein n=1 Tax=Paraburkholderia sp. ZP32-5 TaxID=2883245 RepID=UPI002DD44F94|nr:hypothetical protein [Paraburkholderia sp. ZP32-5]
MSALLRACLYRTSIPRDLDPIPPGVFRLVQRHVRALHQRFHIAFAGRSARDADADREWNRFAQPPPMIEVTSLDRQSEILRDRRGFIHAISR